MQLQKQINDKGESYCITMYDKKDKTYHNEYISYSEYVILLNVFQQLGYRINEKDFRK